MVKDFPYRKGQYYPTYTREYYIEYNRECIHPHVCKGYVFKCDSEAYITGLNMLLIARLTADSKG